MTTQPVEANVVLTADNSGYDQAMSGSAQATEKLMNSVDTLTAKISKLTKTAGKSLIGISIADIGMISAATKAWNDYEKQTERLRSQAAVLGRTQDQGNKILKDYTASVKTLRSEFGTTTTEAANLVETLSKVTSIRQTRDLQELSKVFVEMSRATGESSEGLASSLTNLEKIMGTPVNASNTRKYADTFTYLAAQTNTSAQGLIDFTSSLAPVAKSLGMNTKEVAGFAAAFTQAGQEGGAAATAFTKITSDLNHSLQTGSPELATYANIVGTTSANFKKLAQKDSAEAVIEVFEALSRNTKTASADLERLGLDGPRTIQKITALMQQPGGIRGAMGMAEDPRAKGATQRGFDATMEGLSNQFEELREDLKQTAEAFATILGPAMEGFLTGLEKAASILQEIVQGPIGEFLQVIMGLVAPLAGGAGALLLFAGALFKVAGAFALLRNSMTRGVVEGFQGRPGLVRTPEGTYVGRGGAELGRTGTQLAEGRSTWVQRGLYNIGQFGGAGLGAMRPGRAIPENYYAAREALSAKIPWTQQYTRPEQPRSALNFLSRGAGYAIDQFVTPTFDQMRYEDPTKRRQWAAQEAPWIRAGDYMQTAKGRVGLLGGLTKAMGGVGLAETQLAAQRAETVRVHADPLMTEQAKQARLEELRQMREETMARRNSAKASESAIRQEIATRGEQVRATQDANMQTKTFGQAMKGLGANMAGAGWGGIKAGAGMAWRSGMVGQAGGMAATMAGSATGSNALMLGGTGAMIGSMIAPGIGTAIGAVAGGAAGLAMDMAKANNDVTESIKSLDQQATDASKSGSGLVALADQTDQTQKDLTKLQQDWDPSSHAFWWSPKAALGSTKNWIEGWFGNKNDVEEMHDDLDKTTEKAENVEGAFRDLAKRGGAKIDLTSSLTQQREQLDAFMGSRGIEALGKAGIEIEDFVAARQKAMAEGATAEQKKAYQDMLTQAITPGKATDMWSRIQASGQFGQTMLDDRTMKRSIALQGDIALAYDATNKVFTKMRDSGMSYLDIVRQGERAQAQAGEEGAPEYMRAGALIQKAQYALQMQAPQLGRVGAVQQQLQLTQAVLATKPQTPTDAAEREAQKQAAAQAIADQDQYFRQMLLAQQAYERSRQRAQEDFNLQRKYQEYDYQLSRDRAEESFNRMRSRALADYTRSVHRAWDDFHLQRKRQEEDYRHQIDVTAQQMATGMNLYQRRETQRTSSATWLLANTKDILQKLREQKQNLNRLRQLGFSDAVIQQLQLTDPNNAQELARFVTEVESDRSMAGKFNRQASQLQKASRALVTDESSQTFQEMQRSFRLSRTRGMEDMNRSMDRQRQDFRRGLRQQREDFNIMMDQQAEDYETQQKRQLAAYEKSMDRAAEDMAHMADEITGSITDVLVQAHQKLTGSAKTQAGLALQSFKDLRRDTKPEAVALMQELSEIFGFDYKAPKSSGKTGGGGGSFAQHKANEGPQASGGYHSSGAVSTPYFAGGWGGPQFHEGGVMPGHTPGQDIYNIKVSGGEAIMRPEWTRAIGGEKVVNALNHAARHGGFAAGGVADPDSRVYMDGEPVSKITKAQLLLAEHLSHKNLITMQGSWQPYTSYSGSSHMGPGVVDEAPGNFTTQYWLRRVAFAAWGRNFPGAATAGSGAHVHAVSRLDPGARNHPQLSSFARGEDGLGGPDYGPNPDVVPGIMGMLAQFSNLELARGSSAAGGGLGLPTMTRRQVFRQVLKDAYDKAEQAAANMSGVHPLRPGMISEIVNRFAKRKIRQLMRQYGGPTGGGVGAAAAPGDPSGNAALGKQMAAAMGWTGGEWNSLYQLWQKESGWNERADNPSSSAYGIPQALPGSKMSSAGSDWATNPATQIRWGLNYIKDRYGDPNTAWAHSQSYNWYRDGSVFTSPRTIGIGENGPEAVIPLNERGGEFLARSIGLGASPMGGSVVMHNYRIDRSTNFTGPITVQANDPNELLAKLQQRQRVRALSRPSLTGSAA